ncbi:uncharacterized protein I303_102842 [Kwoniella dejecticola CBS 10117]|uniref:Translocation protein SEC66 n=1 Tax=Kwoniella dejecticola CBS 10117 TaxID=1296121 RepID=A0A1A6A9V6_9TREE|nr:uncharacterized protein I303_02856 [Kwoniella dejecticola CBS 10117]OBR86839.1 hypothetical protein I303_02856 [Kwoniella dejecticola CBS 10117]
MATSLVVPLAYISVMVTALAIFSRVYRRRRAAEKTSFEPWFPKHPSRETYITLISASSSSSNDTPAVPDSLLKSALLVRAITDVKRIWRLRDDKIALTQLSQKGLIGDDTMLRFAAAEKELEAEIVDVVSEANSFRQGWGQMIFATATEMAQAEKTRETVMSIPKIKAQEDKRIALRNKYLPGSVPPPLIQQVPVPPQAAAAGAAASGSGSNTPSPSTTSTSGKVATPQKVPSASGSGSGSPALASTSTVEDGSGESSKNGSPNPNASASGSGSGTNTPSKSTPGKKKKGKK